MSDTGKDQGEVLHDCWHGAYRASWAGMIVPEAFAHPAKFPRALIQRIYQHALAEGWLVPGATCLDVFGGVSLGALDAALAGVHHVSIELEPKFHELAKANIALWERKFGHLPQYVRPTVLQGDSRMLVQLVAQQGIAACVASPPYAGIAINRDREHEANWQQEQHFAQGKTRGEHSAHGYGSDPAQLAALPPGSVDAAISSPPFSGTEQPCASQHAALKDYHAFTRGRGTKRDATHTGDTPGQLSAMATGDVSAVISSPPYADQQVGTGQPGRTGWRGYTDHGGGTSATPGQLAAMTTGDVSAVVSSPPYATGLGKEHTYTDHAKRDKDGHRRIMTEKGIVDHYYGSDPAQLGNMAPGEMEAVVASPPWGDGTSGHDSAFDATATHIQSRKNAGVLAKSYGPHPDQLGNTHGDTFWSASRTILEQVYAVLRPGGHAIWVVKAYCRDGAIVDFPGDWRRLCESVGFLTLHEHHAMLVEHHGTQGGLFGEANDTEYKTSRKSFFRRLHEAKRPDLAIDYEIVYCMVKPLVNDAPPGGAWRCISSPPYVQSVHDGNGIDQGKLSGNRPGPHAQTTAEGYGRSVGQLGAMRPGDVSAVISSPPYAEAIQAGRSGIDKTKGVDPRHPQSQSVRRLEELAEGYGDTAGQLGTMPAGTPPPEVP